MTPLSMIVLSLVSPITDWTDGADAEHSDVILGVVRPYNHLIYSSGDLRILSYAHADARGNISTTRLLFGIDEALAYLQLHQ